MRLTLAYSPCPNDCFMFDAMVHGRIDTEGLEFDVRLLDIDALNAAALAGEFDATKLSFHAYPYCAGTYVLLDAGSALGNNCGPLLISKREIPRGEVAAGGVRIAIPGKLTTPIPLGGIVVRRAAPDGVKQALNRVMRRSVEFAFAHPEASLPYVRAHAQEMSEEVMYKHIDLYVNRYSVDLGPEGRRAIELMFGRADGLGIIPELNAPLFLA